MADFVVILHGAFIVFVVFGGLLALRWYWMPWVHLPAAAWGVAIEVFGWLCPLTPLENTLRRAGGAAGYAGGFIERYVISLIYPAQLTRETQWLLAALVIVVNAVIYAVVWLRRHRHRPGNR